MLACGIVPIIIIIVVIIIIFYFLIHNCKNLKTNNIKIKEGFTSQQNRYTSGPALYGLGFRNPYAGASQTNAWPPNDYNLGNSSNFVNSYDYLGLPAANWPSNQYNYEGTAGVVNAGQYGGVNGEYNSVGVGPYGSNGNGYGYPYNAGTNNLNYFSPSAYLYY